MNKHQDFKHQRIAIFSALLAGVIGNAQAADYSNVYIFGDSLSDNGAYAPILAVPTLSLIHI